LWMESGNLHIRLSVEQPLQFADLQRKVDATHYIRGIKAIRLDSDSQTGFAGDPIAIEMLSGGGRMTRGVLVLSSDSGTAMIPLKGYPAPIEVGGALPPENNYEEIYESIYPNEINQDKSTPVSSA
jgi:hypothetical protein